MVVIKDRKNLTLMLLKAISNALAKGSTTWRSIRPAPVCASSPEVFDQILILLIPEGAGKTVEPAESLSIEDRCLTQER
jgi:hypothetical protein